MTALKIKDISNSYTLEKLSDNELKQITGGQRKEQRKEQWNANLGYIPLPDNVINKNVLIEYTKYK